jgi:hypothetical protein
MYHQNQLKEMCLQLNLLISAIPTKHSYIFIAIGRNKLIKTLDLKNAQHLENPNYIKCRNYYQRF